MANPVPTMADPGDYLLNLINATKGLSGSTGSRSSGTTVSADGISRILQTALQGQGGLAGILAAPAIAGGYNSSTRSLLANDLMARISAEAAAKTSRATETTKQGGTSGNDIFKTLLLKEGLNLGKSLLKGGAGAASGAVAAKGIGAANAGAPWLKDVGGVDFDSYGNFGTNGNTSLSNTLDDWLASSSGGGGGNFFSPSNASSFSPGYVTAAANAMDGEWGWSDTTATAGSVIGSIFGPWGSAAGASIGGAVGEPVGDSVESGSALLNMNLLGFGDVIGNVGNFFGDLFGW